MNIIYFSYKVDGILDTPTSLLYNHLNREHRVFMSDGHHNPLPKDIQLDWGISVHENILDVINCFNFAPKRYMHLEWLIPWDINHDVYGKDWRYSESDIDTKNEALKKYKVFGKYFHHADRKSLASKHFVKYMSELFEEDLSDIPIKYPSADLELCECALAYPIKKPRRTITTVSRLVPHKQIIDIAQALVKWNMPIDWYLIGQGPELKNIAKTVEGSKINAIYYGWLNGVAKLVLMNNSLCVHGWNGVQPAESLLVNSFNISLDDPVMREYYGDSIAYYKDVSHLVELLDYYWRNVDECVARAEEGKNKIINNMLNINTSEQEANFILGLIQNET